MICPGCGGLLAEKPIPHTDVRVDACKACQGLWFDRGALTLVVRSEERHPTFRAEELRPTMHCPRCKVPLTACYYPGSFIVVDRCLKCDGLWLDHNELSEIRKTVREADLRKRLEEAKKAPPGGLKGKVLDFVNAAYRATMDW